MALEIQWQEHDSGTHPLVVLSGEDGMRAAPSKYIERCEDALATLAGGEAPPRWRLGHSDAQDQDNEPLSHDPDLPKEPDGDAGFFEVQEYISKLIHYRLNKH
jgi:hypothetical protein